MLKSDPLSRKGLATLEELEDAIEKLKVSYEQFFSGIDNIDPSDKKMKIRRLISKLTQMRINNPRIRFRFQSSVGRFVSLDQYWTRTMKAINDGRMERKLFRQPVIGMGSTKGYYGKTPPKIDKNKDRIKEELKAHASAASGKTKSEKRQDIESVELTENDIRKAPKPTLNGHDEPKAAPKTEAKPEANGNGVNINSIYAKYVNVQKKVDPTSPTVKKDKLSNQISNQVDRLKAKYGDADIDFKVVEKDNKVLLKPVIKKKKDNNMKFQLKTILFLLSMLCLLAIAACSSDSGDGDVDGDNDSDIEQTESQKCTEGDKSCDGTKARVCKYWSWVVLADCVTDNKICEKGECTIPFSDGDEEEKAEIEAIDNEKGFAVISTSPKDGATGIDPLTAKVLINFNMAIDPDSYTPFMLIDYVGGTQSVMFKGTLQDQNRQVEISLVSQLEQGQTYKVTIKPDMLKSINGDVFEGMSLSFTTSGITDGDAETEPEGPNPLGVKRTIPANEQNSVDTDINGIQVWFDADVDYFNWRVVDKVTITSEAARGQVSFVGEWKSKTMFYLILKEDLKDNMKYTVELQEGLKTLSGGELGAYSFWFSTKEVLDGDVETSVDGDVNDIDVTEIQEIEAEQEEETIINSGEFDDQSINFGSCLVDPKVYNSSTNTPSVEAEWIGGAERVVKVTHKNAEYLSCVTKVSVEFDQKGTDLILTESSTTGTCSDPCPYKVTYNIKWLAPATYNVKILPDNVTTSVLVK